jgi:hypothetical protein
MDNYGKLKPPMKAKKLQKPRTPESQKIRKQARGWKQTKNKQPIPLQAKLRLMVNETKQISLSVLDDTGCFRTKHGSESKCSCSFQMVQTEKLLWVGKHQDHQGSK